MKTFSCRLELYWMPGAPLIERTRQRLGAECMRVLLTAPKANDYYPQLGFEHNPRAWVLKGA